MNSKEQLELIELVFDGIEQDPWMQESFRFVGFTPEGVAHTFDLHLLKEQEAKDTLLRCLHNSITFYMLNKTIRKWIKIYHCYLVFHDVWEKIQANNFDMRKAPIILKRSINELKNKDISFGPEKKYPDFDLISKLVFTNMFVDRHDGRGEPQPIKWEINGYPIFNEPSDESIIEPDHTSRIKSASFNHLFDNLVKFMSAVTEVREHHWRLRKRAIQDLIEGKTLQIYPEQLQTMQEMSKKFQQDQKIYDDPVKDQVLWIQIAYHEKLIIPAEDGKYILGCRSVEQFKKALLSFLINHLKGIKYPEKIAKAYMPTNEEAAAVILKRNGAPYGIDVFKKA